MGNYVYVNVMFRMFLMFSKWSEKSEECLECEKSAVQEGCCSRTVLFYKSLFQKGAVPEGCRLKTMLFEKSPVQVRNCSRRVQFEKEVVREGYCLRKV